jgi:hypothetical protein
MQYQQTITGPCAHPRWPGYAVTGAGSLAVVLECNRRVVLVMMPLQAHALAAEKCCATCSHIAAPGAGLHRIVEMEQPHKEAPRRSMRRLPGWGDDD